MKEHVEITLDKLEIVNYHKPFCPECKVFPGQYHNKGCSRAGDDLQIGVCGGRTDRGAKESS